MKSSALTLVAVSAFCLITSAYAAPPQDGQVEVKAAQMTTTDGTGPAATSEECSGVNSAELPQIDPDP